MRTPDRDSKSHRRWGPCGRSAAAATIALATHFGTEALAQAPCATAEDAACDPHPDPTLPMTTDLTIGPCDWFWTRSGNQTRSARCGPTHPGSCTISQSVADVSATGIYLAGFGRAQSFLCPADAYCNASTSSDGSLFFTYVGDPFPVCEPRIRVEWSPRWNYTLEVEPPALAAIAGVMSGISQATGVQVQANRGEALSSLPAPLSVDLGPFSVPIYVSGSAGSVRREVADHKAGEASAEFESISWFGALEIEVRTETTLFNWVSESDVEVCRSDPGLKVTAKCRWCAGQEVVEYRAP